MSKFGLKYTNDEGITVGASKLFGMPDMPYDLDWPTFNEEGEEYDLEFVAQLSATDTGRGYLYFFFDLYGDKEELGKGDSHLRVMHFDGAASDLVRFLFVDESGKPDEEYDVEVIPVAALVKGEDVTALEQQGGEILLLDMPLPDGLAFDSDDNRLRFYLSKTDFDKGDYTKAYAKVV